MKMSDLPEDLRRELVVRYYLSHFYEMLVVRVISII